MGIDPLYYLDEMSQDEVAAALKAWRKNEDQRAQMDWEMARLMSYYSATAFGTPTIPGVGPVKKPSDLFKLPWDVDKSGDQIKTKPLSRDEFNEKARAIKESLEKRGALKKT